MGPEETCQLLDRAEARKGNGFVGAQDSLPAPAGSAGLDGAIGPPDWRARQIREWLLLILRFAVTREARDQIAVFGNADELDAIGLEWRPAAPSFFRRTSSEICDAIAAPDGPMRSAVLKRHLARIDDLRLRQALQAAVGLPGRQLRTSRVDRQHLWAGLAANLNRRSGRSA